ncbi:unnamed protein product [Cladocopium goreaui]|uniref:Uncharacterized protein n=1 Tax=Cladocopium goreaui TaxID=2562237 RepID=A0A9P1G8W1_9DINO|nr:unnamed protein product [Cladocopium goreaui]
MVSHNQSLFSLREGVVLERKSQPGLKLLMQKFHAVVAHVDLTLKPRSSIEITIAGADGIFLVSPFLIPKATPAMEMKPMMINKLKASKMFTEVEIAAMKFQFKGCTFKKFHESIVAHDLLSLKKAVLKKVMQSGKKLP